MPVTIDGWRITGQSQIDSYVGGNAELAVLMVNTLAVTRAHGRQVEPPQTGEERRAALAAERPSATRLSPADADALAAAAGVLRPLFAPDASPSALNDLLVRHAAVPNLHGDPPRLAFHRLEASLGDAWIAQAGTALAMIIGVGQGRRLGSCQADGCDLVFVDTTRNASRRFCGLSCQNRAKATAYRARRGST